MSIKLHDNFRFIIKKGADRCVVCNKHIYDGEFCLSIKRRYTADNSGSNITIHINCINGLCGALTGIKRSYNHLKKKFHGMRVECLRIGYLTLEGGGYIRCSCCNIMEDCGIKIYRDWSHMKILIGIKCVNKVVKLLKEGIKKHKSEIVANLL